MILKEKDPNAEQLQELEVALEQATSSQDRQRRERRLAQYRAGLKGEAEAAYHINFHLKDSRNWAIIHDLRIEWNERTAQIDHLLISRLLEIYVVESKSFRTKVRYAHGGWQTIRSNHWEGIDCPLQQNERHIAVLEEMIRGLKLAPKRLGIVLAPRLYNVVVVQPTCSIIGKYDGPGRIWRLDSLVTKVRSDEPNALDLMKMLSDEGLRDFATKLVACHKPAPLYKVVSDSAPLSLQESFTPNAASAAGTCQGCGGLLTPAEAGYCRQNEARFAGNLLCRKCQSYVPKPDRATTAPTSFIPKPIRTSEGPRCETCGAAVDQKVVFYCRRFSKQVGGRLLCRDCQP